MSGREFFAAWRRGKVVPPMAATLDLDLSDFGDGHVEITRAPDEFHYSPYGMVHGGLAASLLDTAPDVLFTPACPQAPAMPRSI